MGAPTGFPYESEAESDRVLESEKEEEGEAPDPDGLELLNDPEVRGEPTGVP